MRRPWSGTVAVGGVLAAVAAAAAWGQAPAAAPAEPAAMALPRPPFIQFNFQKGRSAPTTARLVKISARRNRITDEARWFSENGLSLPAVSTSQVAQPWEKGELPLGAPPTYAGQLLLRAVRDGKLVHLLYGKDYSGARYVAVFDPDNREVRRVFDFQAFVKPPLTVPGEAAYVDELVQWADEEEGVLYVSNFHSTYARSSRGMNGYLTALELQSGKPLWRSRALVCNSRNFAVSGDALIAGYGFTAEPDWLYVLDRKTGAVVQKLRLASGPEYVIARGDRVFVRCYNTDYVFKLTR